MAGKEQELMWSQTLLRVRGRDGGRMVIVREGRSSMSRTDAYGILALNTPQRFLILAKHYISRR